MSSSVVRSDWSTRRPDAVDLGSFQVDEVETRYLGYRALLVRLDLASIGLGG